MGDKGDKDGTEVDDTVCTVVSRFLLVANMIALELMDDKIRATICKSNNRKARDSCKLQMDDTALTDDLRNDMIHLMAMVLTFFGCAKLIVCCNEQACREPQDNSVTHDALAESPKEIF